MLLDIINHYFIYSRIPINSQTFISRWRLEKGTKIALPTKVRTRNKLKCRNCRDKKVGKEKTKTLNKQLVSIRVCWCKAEILIERKKFNSQIKRQFSFDSSSLKSIQLVASSCFYYEKVFTKLEEWSQKQKQKVERRPTLACELS